MYKNTFLTLNTGVCSDTTYQDVSGETLPSNKLRCFDRLVANTATTKPTLYAFGFKVGASIFWLGSGVPSVNGQPVSISDKVWAPGNYVPFVRVFGATSGELISFYTYGYITEALD